MPKKKSIITEFFSYPHVTEISYGKEDGYSEHIPKENEEQKMAADPSPITQVTVAWITLGGVALGALISGGFMFWSQTLTRKSEERRQRREIAINTALANWKSDMETARDLGNKGITGVAVAPLDHYIVHMIKLSDLISRENLTEEEIAAELTKISKASRDTFEAAKAQDKKEGRYPFHDSSQE